MGASPFLPIRCNTSNSIFKKDLIFSKIVIYYNCSKGNERKRRRTLHKPERVLIMKKTTMNTILSLIATIDTPEAEAVRTELTAELNKGQARKDATVTAYAEMWETVRQALTDATAPVTAQEIADETGLSRGKIVYGLTHLWTEEVVKDTSGKSTTYALKA